MAYYDNLIAAWNSATQPPTGVTGAPLTPTMPPPQRVATINAWTITGAIPATIFVTADQVFNCIDFGEFNALTQVKQTNVLAMLAVNGQLLGGSANVSHLLPGMLVNYFPPGGVTITALTALAKSATQSWAQVNGYPYSGLTGLLNGNDLVAAGLTVVPINAPSLAGENVLRFASVPSWMANGLEVHDLGLDGADIPIGTKVVASSSNTVTVTNIFTGTGLAAGDPIGFV